ncbi:hypothetical protein U14_03788 [Candidatus Moduliflexus flocculans]|uniref:SWIM-type domain-containing protein n=1 Tax=Candidatus Moduliflexus flocculans TaxID=1499966 RepID=A0A081BQ71_9BACT|nr:hypothetical protein U14_03788 [Candidatus Moduliflexus flocculans]
MKLSDYTIDYVKRWAGGAIFQRGENYARQGMVQQLEYNPDADTLQASVAGSGDEYDVEISARSDSLTASCTCPYDGWPCKHIVAAMLAFFAQKDELTRQAARQKKADSTLAKKLAELPSAELVTILLECAKKYPDLKRELAMRFEANKEATFTSIKKQIARAFPDIESDYYDTRTIAKQLRSILASTTQAAPEIRAKVCWAAIDRILKELNNYGMDDEPLEDAAMSAMDELAAAFQAAPELGDARRDVIAQLLNYYHNSNCGLTDWIYDSAVQLCAAKEDYRLVIESLKQAMKKTNSSYYQGLLAQLYEATGDTEAQRRTLEAHLKDGIDYWRLAQYWLAQHDRGKALEVAWQGIERGEGRKVEVYAFVQDELRQRGDYKAIAGLLHRKVEKQEFDTHHHFLHDGTYNCLWEHYAATHDYDGQKYLLNLRLDHHDIDLDFFKTAKACLHETDWPAFEARIIADLEERAQARQKTPPAWFVPNFPNQIMTLAEIYDYLDDYDRLFDTIKHQVELLRQYESKLLPHFSAEYLELYQNVVNRLIAARGRDSYNTAAQYAQTIRHIYVDVRKTPQEWEQYIGGLRAENKRLRVFLEEFAHV